MRDVHLSHGVQRRGVAPLARHDYIPSPPERSARPDRPPPQGTSASSRLGAEDPEWPRDRWPCRRGPKARSDSPLAHG
eukprot:5464310-Pyramimonas_sp.AAC.1